MNSVGYEWNSNKQCVKKLIPATFKIPITKQEKNVINEKNEICHNKFGAFSYYKSINGNCVCVKGYKLNSENQCINSIKEGFAKKEKELIKNLDKKLSNKLKGKILLQVENNGEAWYVHPQTGKRYYMANGNKAFAIMRNLGVGITNKNLDKIQTDNNFAKKHSGKIFLQVEDRGQAYYIDFEGNAHYLKNGQEAYRIMRDLGLGISNDDIRKIDIE